MQCRGKYHPPPGNDHRHKLKDPLQDRNNYSKKSIQQADAAQEPESPEQLFKALQDLMPNQRINPSWVSKLFNQCQVYRIPFTFPLLFITFTSLFVGASSKELPDSKDENGLPSTDSPNGRLMVPQAAMGHEGAMQKGSGTASHPEHTVWGGNKDKSSGPRSSLPAQHSRAAKSALPRVNNQQTRAKQKSSINNNAKKISHQQREKRIDTVCNHPPVKSLNKPAEVGYRMKEDGKFYQFLSEPGSMEEINYQHQLRKERSRKFKNVVLVDQIRARGLATLEESFKKCGKPVSLMEMNQVEYDFWDGGAGSEKHFLLTAVREMYLNPDPVTGDVWSNCHATTRQAGLTLLPLLEQGKQYFVEIQATAADPAFPDHVFGLVVTDKHLKGEYIEDPERRQRFNEKFYHAVSKGQSVVNIAGEDALMWEALGIYIDRADVNREAANKVTLCDPYMQERANSHRLGDSFFESETNAMTDRALGYIHPKGMKVQKARIHSFITSPEVMKHLSPISKCVVERTDQAIVELIETRIEPADEK